MISLVLPTKNRVHEFELFLISLEQQSDQDYELIIVDQNTDTKIDHIIEKKSCHTYNISINFNYMSLEV